MLLNEIKEWFKKECKKAKAFEQVSIGKIDNNLDKALCFYNSKTTPPYINKLGASSYSIKALTILMRYGKNQNDAEIMANELYKFFDKKDTLINEKRVFFSFEIETPISLGTDDKGIIEYSFEINLYYERKV